MDSSTGFFDFIFSDNPKDSKAAYESLDSHPYQIFDLLLKEGHFTNFFSRIEVYGNNLANLLSQFPRFQQDDYRASLLREMIRAFALSLLAERFDDMRSLSAVARIVLSVVKLSDPRRTLGQFGVRLGALPGILRVLIAEGHIKKLAQTHKRCFEDLISEPQAREKWVEFIMELCKECKEHGSKPSTQELVKFIRTVPCEFCNSNVSFDCGLNDGFEGEPTPVWSSSFGLGMESNVFKYLLGEPLGPWKIILSEQAMEDLGVENTQNNFENIRRKFSELASGDWAGKKILHRAKWDNSLSYRIPLFKAFYKTQHFILWQIDTAFDERFGEDYQVIKVWAIGNPDNLDKIGVQIHREQQMYTQARVEACDRDDLDGSREIRYPVRVCLDGGESGVMEVDGAGNGDFEDSARLAKFYSLTSTILDNIASTAGKVAYPVGISAEQASVVDHFLTPAFILGRGGTGKTTCLVYKLVGRYLFSRENVGPLRQVLLTKSKKSVSKLRDNTAGLLEAKLGERQGLTGSYDLDDNTRKQFLSLTDADFPLVCTFDCLLRLIENSIRDQKIRRRYIKIDNAKDTRVTDLVKFNIEYWERLPPRLKKGIRVDLAFLEIMGVIKGSVSRATGFEPLSRKEYLGLRWQLAPSFASERERHTIYDIYEWYERAKKKRGDIDQVDRIIKVTKALEAFRSSEVPGDSAFELKVRSVLDEIYVDEVQDQRMSDIGMLLDLVGSPRGIHFAGDTAQCISEDALFRFANAKSLFYERFKNTTSISRDLKPTLLPLSHNFRSHKQILSVASLVMHLLYRGFPGLVDKLPPEIGDRPGPQPALYVGRNIMDVLRFGEKLESPHGSGGKSGKFNEYGKARVILVRDEKTCDKLQAELGRSSLVLTILESKSMEFEDVFLYDFFSTSPYSHKLNILDEIFKRRHHTDLSLEDHLGLAGESGNGKVSRPGGKAGPGSRHNTSAYQGGHADWVKKNIVLCSELKHLYVGVTRARSRLWILESNTRILGPVQRLFNQTATLLEPHQYPSPILEILTERDIGISELHHRLSTGKTISASQWRETGYQMIEDQKYSKALRCFEDAEDPYGTALANAYITEQNAITNRALGSVELANIDFIKASEFFLKARSIAKAVECRKEGGDPKGAVKILADNGAYEDAAWLSADIGSFLETSEIYTKLNKHGRALTGYARAKQFKRMFSYIRKFKAEIEPFCWKQYVLFGYLKEFGERDTPPDEPEKRVLDLFGSIEEQKMVLLRFGMINKLFKTLSTNGRYMEAYEIGVSFGLLANSIHLLSENSLLKNLKPEKRALLNTVCGFLQAEHIATNPWPRTRAGRGIHKVLRAAVGRGSPLIDSFVEVWEDINRALDNSAKLRNRVEIGTISDASYMDILVTRRSAYLNNEPQPPLDHIERVLKDLRKISSHGAIPYSAQLYCGIYEMPHQPGEYILLDWSPFRASSKLSFPLSPVDIGPLRGKILRQILGDIVSPLVSFDAGLRQIWSKKAEPQFPPPPALAETHFEKLDWLARICQIFLESSAVIEVNRQPKDSLLRNWDWGFWRGVLLEQMEFKSSYEQRLEVLCGIRSRLMTRGGKYHSLYPFLINDDTTQSRIESTLQMGTWDCVFSLLAQYQISLFLDYEDQWMSTLSELGNGIMGWENPSLEYGCGVVTLVHQFISETKAGDFPGRFCENIYSILDVMESVESSLNFYSPSIIALYEELTLSLIFLVRPYEFLVPESWHDLYFRRWERKYRSPSVLERFRYQQCLVKVCLSFCELVINIEGWHAKEITLARRSVILIVVCLINLGTTFPRPQEYAELWQKSQEVFLCPRLSARGILGLQGDELIRPLTKVFKEYKGRDSVCLVWGYEEGADSFAGVPLDENCISVVASHPIEERKRHLWEPSRDQRTRELNAAHILTAFWKLNGPRFLQSKKERRNAASPFNCFWETESADISGEGEETQGHRTYFDSLLEIESAEISSEDEGTQEHPTYFEWLFGN